VYRSTQPVWNDRNLHHFIEKTESQLFIAHIRASTVGVVSEANCHPFSYGAYMMAHNGTIKNFSLIKRALLAQLPEHLFLAIQGTTDSECLFYLIISFLEQGDTSLPEAIAAATRWVATAQETLSDESYSKINLIFSDGHRIVAAKYASKAQKCHSLVIGRHPLTGGVVISSEIVGFNKKNWHQIPDNSIISVLKQEEVWAIEPYERYLLRKMD
jgi:glutamine amidotransferase